MPRLVTLLASGMYSIPSHLRYAMHIAKIAMLPFRSGPHLPDSERDLVERFAERDRLNLEDIRLGATPRATP